MAGSAAARAAIAQLRAAGLTEREIGEAIGTSQRVVRHVLAGKGGQKFEAPLRHLLDTGRPAPAAPRAQRVRAPEAMRAEGVKSVPRTLKATAPPHGFSRDVTLTRGGRGRLVIVEFPKTPGPGRARGHTDLMADLARADRAGQKVQGMRVLVAFPDGPRWVQRVAHGQSARSIRAAAKRDSFAGLFGVIAGMFPNGSAGVNGARILGVELDLA